MRLSRKNKEFLDNSSDGSFINNIEEEAWNLLETIAENTGYWDLDKGSEPYLDYQYSCVENFSTSILFKNLSDTLDRKSTRLNSSHITRTRMPSSA